MTAGGGAYALKQEVHRPVDGSRPLIFDRAYERLLSVEVLDVDANPLTCWTALWSDRFGAAYEPYDGCRGVIRPLEHYLLWTPRSVLDVPIPHGEQAYCAPCAVREWAGFGVREVAA